ncbi:zinc-dependent metalloprotease [Ramlibacter solisilvae]|uniref:zinc-dependent metalloprotease n=1 Tax=Ramlibacter tataouinensis TaxID=94132 RepID=UPI000777CA54|nr:zinc-dependent metalloprotease [Ramlibacter tataouinensis]
MKSFATAALAAFLSFAAAAESPVAGRKQDGVAEAAATPASAPASAAARPPADPAAPKPFDEVLKGATRQDGLLPIWRKDEKAWLEIPPEMVGKPFLFTANIANSVGERGLYASHMGMAQLVQIRIVGRQLQLLAINTGYRAVADQGGKRAIEEAFSPSLIASAGLASAEHPERKSLLVDASFLLADIPGYSTAIEKAYRLPFSVDRANSSFERARAEAKLSTLTARIHFSTPRIPAPPMSPAANPMPPPPATPPDPRSFFVDYVYSFLALPAETMAPRLADPRLGHFTESFTDLGGDLKANPRTHYITRWRLEKKDPAAALSEPVKPIVFWLDKNIPPKYRPTVAAGVLEWNKAFERIGFKNAIVVQQQADEADWDNMDAGHASIRWFVGADAGYAIGPSQTDPRSGEILDADIGMSDVFARISRRAYVEDVGKPAAPAHAELPWTARNGRLAFQCDDAHMAAMDTAFALDLLEAREEIGPDSPEAQAFVLSAIKGTIMHEVGHVLGLKHNFKGSTTVTAAQLQDLAYTQEHGLGNSVMEYVPVNLALKGEKQGAYHRNTLGAYDYWAIEYAYRPFDAAAEAQELARIAARSTEPQLAYADDIEAGWGSYEGTDPLANRFDLGDNPLAWFRKRLALSQELWTRAQERPPRAGDDPLRARRAISSGFGPLTSIAEMAAKYVGGMHASRELPGSGRAAFTPVDPVRQREALRFLEKGLFSADSFRFRPEFLTTLGVDYNEVSRSGPPDIAGSVGRVQFTALDRLMSAGTASRLLDLPSYVPASQRKDLISLNEVYQTVQRAVWSELATGGDIDRIRRNLQREHMRRLQALLTRGSGLPADAVSLIRYNARQLEAQLRTAVARHSGSVEVRAHLAESLGVLTEALNAKMQRS